MARCTPEPKVKGPKQDAEVWPFTNQEGRSLFLTTPLFRLRFIFVTFSKATVSHIFPCFHPRYFLVIWSRLRDASMDLGIKVPKKLLQNPGTSPLFCLLVASPQNPGGGTPPLITKPPSGLSNLRNLSQTYPILPGRIEGQ